MGLGAVVEPVVLGAVGGDAPAQDGAKIGQGRVSTQVDDLIGVGLDQGRGVGGREEVALSVHDAGAIGDRRGGSRTAPEVGQLNGRLVRLLQAEGSLAEALDLLSQARTDDVDLQLLRAEARRLNDFLGADLAISAMSAAVDPALHRQRKTTSVEDEVIASLPRSPRAAPEPFLVVEPESNGDDNAGADVHAAEGGRPKAPFVHGRDGGLVEGLKAAAGAE